VTTADDAKTAASTATTTDAIASGQRAPGGAAPAAPAGAADVAADEGAERALCATQQA
jgi:hypothetical protein